jgi:hypothetical protein
MPGFNQTQLNPNAQNSNAVVVMVGDQVIAFGQTSTQTVDWGTEQLYGIGSGKPQEVQQLKISPSISLDAFALTSHGLQILNYPSTLLQVLSNNQFDISVIDSNGNVLLNYIGCVASNFNQNIPVNAIITQTISFMAMDVIDSLGNSILNGNFALNNIQALAIAGAGLNAVGA